MLYKGCTRGVCMEECVYQKLHALMRVVVSMIAYLDSNFLPILDHFSNNVSTTENHFEHPYTLHLYFASCHGLPHCQLVRLN